MTRTANLFLQPEVVDEVCPTGHKPANEPIPTSAAAGLAGMRIAEVLHAEHSPVPHAAERRLDLFAVLDEHEDNVRFWLSAQHLRPAVDAAVWQASWDLRKRISEALDDCTHAERRAWWARDE